MKRNIQTPSTLATLGLFFTLFSFANENQLSAQGGTASGGNATIAMTQFSYECSISGAKGVVKEGIQINSENWNQTQGTSEVQIMLSVGTSPLMDNKMAVSLEGILFGKTEKFRAVSIGNFNDSKISLYLIHEYESGNSDRGRERAGYLVSCVKQSLSKQ
jgi:hypothetical protein